MPNPSSAPPLSPWERLKHHFLKGILGALVLSALALFTFSRELRDFVHSLQSSDLVIHPLTSRGVAPLDGYGIIVPASGSPSPIYAGGCRITLLLEHNHHGDIPITVTAIRLKVLDFDPVRRPELAYEVNADAIVGAGTRKPHIYQVRLLGDRVEPATWLPDGDAPVVTARSDNFLDTERPFFPVLESKQPPELIQVTVVAETPGKYEITFTIDYIIQNKERDAAPAGKLVIYSQE